MAQDMNALTSRIIWLGALFIIVFLSGFWLYRSGRPINTILLTLHKLIALGALILIGVTVYQSHQIAALTAAAWITVVVMGVCFVATIITGGLLSLAQPVTSVTIVHRIGPFLTVAGAIVTMYLLASPQS
jgi:hypothetical protein